MRQTVLHIGMGKAGSTFLQHWFTKQPDILSLRDYSNLCEQICRAGLALSATPDERSTLLIRSGIVPFETPDPSRFPVLSEERFAAWQGYRADPAPGYDVAKYRTAVCDILNATFPGAKILLITRGYAALLRSSYSQYISSGGDKKFRQRLLKHRKYFYAILSIDDIVALYRKAFGDSSISLVPFELLQENPQAFLAKVASVIGLDHVGDYKVGRSNESIGRSEMRIIRHLSTLVNRAVTDPDRKLEYRHLLRRIVVACTTSHDPMVQKTLQRIRRQVAEEELELPEDYLEPLRGTATVLADDPIYRDYRDQYLL